MPLTEQQLQAWSNQGAVTTAKQTHESVRAALDASDALNRHRFEVYLQGSYKNSTNIRGDSDVDVVVQLNDQFWYETDGLSEEALRLCLASIYPATYHWHDFRNDVLRALRSWYGPALIEEGNRAISVKPASGRLPADVIVCQQYRRYTHFNSPSDFGYVEGMRFYALNDNQPIVNFPKLHYDNGVAKNAYRTDDMYKPVVRMFKNARNRVIDAKPFMDGFAPSYFVECLLYNVPDQLFTGRLQDCYVNIVNWLSNANMERFVCQNEQTWLFGTESTQWNTDDASMLVYQLGWLWHNG